MKKIIAVSAIIILIAVISSGCVQPEESIVGDWQLAADGNTLGNGLEMISEALNSAISALGLNGVSIGTVNTGNKITINPDGSGTVKTAISYTIDALALNIGIIEIGAGGDFIWNKEDTGYNFKLNKNTTYTFKILNGETHNPEEFLTKLLGDNAKDIIAKINELNIPDILMAQDSENGLTLTYAKDDSGKETLAHNGSVLYTKL